MAATAAATTAGGIGPLLSKVGENIFVYTHVRTRQTIYSLRRTMRNPDALRQLTFVGKKSVPAALRKDMWAPLCVLSFPSSEQGLDAYNKLRQFRLLHETQYDEADVLRPAAGEQGGSGSGSGNGNGRAHVSRKQKTRILQDQKANSVADMAHVLAMQTRPPTEAEVERARWWTERPRRRTRDGRAYAQVPDRPRFGKGSKLTVGDVAWRGSVSGVRISWRDVLDAEYAETWPRDVVHARLETDGYKPLWPAPDEASRSAEAQGELEAADGATAPQVAEK